MTKKELEEIRHKLVQKEGLYGGYEEFLIQGFDACAEILLPKLEHAEKMKKRHWEIAKNILSNVECLEKNVHELLEEKSKLKQIINDYEEALEQVAKGHTISTYEGGRNFSGAEVVNTIKQRVLVTRETDIAREVLKKHRGNE